MKIIQKDKTHFILESESESESNMDIIFNSIIDTNLLSFAFIYKYNYKNKFQLNFHADSVVYFKEYILKKDSDLDLDLSMQLFFSLGKQIHCLEKMKYTFTGFGDDFNDIIVINNCYFFYLNANYLMPFYNNNNNNNNICFLHPFEKPYFSSPEILNISSLPAFISKKSVYYSLGCLIIYFLFDVFILKGNDIISDVELNNILKPIYGTKIYWTLLRCLKVEVEVDRSLLYI